MLKDKVIKPLLVATEKVVEYYFPEEKKLGEVSDALKSSQNHDIQMGDASEIK